MSFPAPSATKRKPVVWVAMGYWVDPIFRGIAAYASEHGWILDASMQWRRGPIVTPAKRPDGVIVFTGDTPGLEEAVRSCGAPIVDIENYRDLYGAPKVIGDDEDIGRKAARHLLPLKPAQLVYAGHTTANPSARLRAKGFVDEAAASGVRAAILSPAEVDFSASRNAGPIAIFANGDELASELMSRALDAGLRVPDDVAILGADDVEHIRALIPVALSSVNMDFEGKGRAAAALLDGLMRGEPVPARPVVSPIRGVMARASTHVLHTGDDRLDRLVRHLRENANRPVKIGTLCEECGMPIRTAQHLLRTKLAVTPAELLTRYRLESAETLKKQGVLKTAAIAKAAGFGSVAAMRRAQRTKG